MKEVIVVKTFYYFRSFESFGIKAIPNFPCRDSLWQRTIAGKSQSRSTFKVQFYIIRSQTAPLELNTSWHTWSNQQKGSMKGKQAPD